MLYNVFNFQKFLYHFLHAESMVKTNHICHKVQFGVNLNVYKTNKNHSHTNTKCAFLIKSTFIVMNVNDNSSMNWSRAT